MTRYEGRGDGAVPRGFADSLSRETASPVASAYRAGAKTGVQFLKPRTTRTYRWNPLQCVGEGSSGMSPANAATSTATGVTLIALILRALKRRKNLIRRDRARWCNQRRNKLLEEKAHDRRGIFLPLALWRAAWKPTGKNKIAKERKEGPSLGEKP